MLPAKQIRLLKRFLFLLIAYSFLRIGYYFYHISIYKTFSQIEILQSFILGIRFDLAAVLLVNLPVIILSLLPSQNSKLIIFERWLFVIINSIALLVSLIDYELFLFVGKRMSFDLFVITGDIWDQLPQLALYYWYFPVVCMVIGYSFYYFDKYFCSLNSNKPSTLSQYLSGLTLLGLCFVGIRGGLQHKSINVQSAFTQGNNELGNLVLNTPYHFLRTLKNQSYSKVKYFNSDKEAIDLIKSRRSLLPVKTNLGKKNIVLIILESFSSEYLEKGYMPFVDSLKSKSLYFPFHLANGRRSIEVLPSVLCGLPSLLNEPLSKSIFQSNKFSCLPKLLKNLGYQNFFFHGGARGTMGFESFTLANGFDRYFSRDDHPDGEYDGTWGIYDGPYLEFVAQEINKMSPPFMAGIFTLSSHQPYSVPKKFHGKFPKGTLEIHESIGYTDFALKEFFNKIQDKSWFKDTIFIITADHTSKLETKKYQNLIGHYRVPLLIYSPGIPLKGNTQKVVQHSDIPRSILSLVGGDEEKLPATSVNIFSEDKGYALNYVSGSEFFLVGLNQVIGLSKNGQQIQYSYDWESGVLIKIGESDDQLLKAYIQYFTNGLLNNNLSI